MRVPITLTPVSEKMLKRPALERLKAEILATDDAVVAENRIWELMMERVTRYPEPRLIIETLWTPDESWVSKRLRLWRESR